MVRNATVSLLSIVLTLAVLELAARLWYGSGDRIPPHPDAGVRDEWRWAAQHLAAGQPVVEGLSGFDPALGWREPGELADWIARKGWNTPADVFADAPPPRTLFIGDSFTAGLHVAPEEAFAFRYGIDHVPAGETFNLGVSGYGLDQMLLLYEQEGVRLHADTVVLGLYLGGYTRALAGFTYYAKPRFVLAADHDLRIVGQPVPSPQSLYEAYATGTRTIGGHDGPLLADVVTSAWSRWRARDAFHSDQTPEWALFSALLQRFAQHARRLGDRPVVLLIPGRLEDFRGSVEADLEARVTTSACDLGLTAVALSGPFQAYQANPGSPPLFRPREDGGHFSVEGHREAAAVLARVLGRVRDTPPPSCPPAAAARDTRAVHTRTP